MTKTLKRLDLLVREVQDPHAQENFWRLRNLIEDLGSNGVPGPQGPAGPPGPQGPVGPTPTTVPKVVVTFTTDAGTLATHLVRVSAANTVIRITDNLSATIPNGIFGIGLSKPSATQIEVIFMGILGGYSGLTIGSPLFISTAGIPTHTPPATGMVQQIGFAVSATELFVHMLQPMRRN
jgi:hypothetical protein